ncbi:MAG TPA: DUF6632 domain-containing protein [Candidatus Methylomirabilis sp.]|nr:DUF6632 domain-containing protein [Candidatus Methylomirabilis sp.]
MARARALQVAMVLVGLLFVAAAYPMLGGVLHPDQSDTGDTMMMGLYATLGVFLLVAVRNPAAHRSLIAFAAWSSFAHAGVMSSLGFKMPSERDGFLIGSAVLIVIGVVLLALAPAKPSMALVSAARESSTSS